MRVVELSGMALLLPGRLVWALLECVSLPSKGGGTTHDLVDASVMIDLWIRLRKIHVLLLKPLWHVYSLISVPSVGL